MKDELSEPREWVEADDTRRVGDEVRARIDVVDVGLIS